MELGKKIRQLRVKAGLTQELLAYLYWHRSNAKARKASRYAKEAIRRAPNEKGCQWILSKADPPAGESVTQHKTGVTTVATPVFAQIKRDKG